jgi:hypothetical protein
VMECMQRAVRIASAMAEAQAPVFAVILSHYLYYFQAGYEQVTPQFLSALLELVGGKVETKRRKGLCFNTRKMTESEQPVPLWTNSLRHLSRMKKEQPQKYGEVKF